MTNKDIASANEPAIALAQGDLSGWRGGIGMAFGNPASRIPDITELGYEIAWGSENPVLAQALDLAVFRYWNSIVETSLKGRTYDFSDLEDKNKAAKLAFDAWMAERYGVKGLSEYASVKHNPGGAYGDVYGTMDLASENPLVAAVIDDYLNWFIENAITRGGIALDNAGRVPEAFLAALKKRLNALGLGIATNGCPDKYLPYIDFFGNEGFPFTIGYAQAVRAKGFMGIMGEFTMRHLSPGEMESYLKNKLFDGIVFFGYTNGGRAAGAQYSFYAFRPDVYNHHRRVLRQYVPLSRAIREAGRQADPLARIKSAAPAPSDQGDAQTAVAATTDADGKVIERAQGKSAGGGETFGDSATEFIARFGNDIARGVYLFVNSAPGKSVSCDARRLDIPENAVVYDEFQGRTLENELTESALEFSVGATPTLVQLGRPGVVAANILARTADMLKQGIEQRRLECETDIGYLLKPWAPFCQGYELDTTVKKSGAASLKTEGGEYLRYNKWRYHNRCGAAQLVVLNQGKPARLILTAHSRAADVPASALTQITDRSQHFNCREGFFYCMHLYLDCQDGAWPEIRTAAFSAGSHDWEKRVIEVLPRKPAKTAMALLEFHQPSGAAWFDDVSLIQEGGPDKNLLAYPGFADDRPAGGKPDQLDADYDRKLAIVVDALIGMARQDKIEKKELVSTDTEIESLENWVADVEMGRFWQRELRDLADARDQIARCLKLARK